MNFIYDYRETSLTSILHDDIDIIKFIKSIKKLSKANDNLFIIGECITSDVDDKSIYINIKNKKVIVNFSHIYYDGYSIFLIFKKIDEIYKGEIDNYKFSIYDSNYSKFKILINNIKLLPKIKLKNISDGPFLQLIIGNIFNRNKNINKKRIKILKTKFNEQVSTKEIIYYLVDKINIKNYCLILNARKQFSEYENYLGNLVYFSDTLNKNDEIKISLQKKNKEISLETKLNNTFPNEILVNSYLNFTLPSFIKYLIPPIRCGNYILIHPINSNERYILVDYCYYTKYY